MDIGLYNTLLIIQYVCIFGLFIESWVIIRKWKNNVHTFLLLSCLAALVNNLGYLLELRSVSLDAYISSLKFSYLGRVWYAFFMFLFLAELFRIKIPSLITRFLIVLHAAIFMVIMTVQYHGLYYSSLYFESDGPVPKIVHGNGPVHHVFMVIQIGYIVIGLGMLLRALHKEKNKFTRKRYFIIMLAIFVESLFFIIQLFNLLPVTNVFDVTLLGYFFGTIIMLIAIFSYDLLGTREIAKDFIVDRISEGIIAVDNDGIIRYYNDPALELFPELAQDVTTVPAEIINAIAENGNIQRNDRIYSPEDNDLIHDGKVFGTIYALVDETEHIRYMAELQEQRDIADNANAAKSRFLANMSHEIRTPINAVLGMDEMILRESREDTIRSYASDIMSAGKTLLSLINDILDLSKVEEGKMEIVPVQYELATLINDLVNMISDRAVKKSLKFNVEVNENIPHVLFGDEMRIRQCALNILTNAVKYTEKGSVSLKIDYREKDWENIYLQFTVSDTGIGMKEEDIEKLFQPYQRIEEERNRAIEGTGLGMSITRQLLDLMGTELEVQSEYGKGSTFTFAVEQKIIDPDKIGDYAQRFSEKKEKDHIYRELFHAPDARILVVDDTEMNLTVMQSLLKQTQIRIDTASTGKDAITLATVNKYDVLFIDHMMPDMDGIETLKNIRETQMNQSTAAVALTANAVSGARDNYINSGFSDYLSKPVDSSLLEKMLYTYIPKDKLKKATEDSSAAKENSSLERPRIFVIDDDETVCSTIDSILSPLYEIELSLTGADAVKRISEYNPDLVLLDIHLSDGNGFEIMDSLKKEDQTAAIPILLITGDDDTQTEENAFRRGASDFIRKPFAPDILKQRTKRIIELYHYQRSIEDEVLKQTSRSERLSREMMLALSKTVDTKDHYTDGHSRRVAAMAAEIARRLGKPADEQVEIFEIGLLHDIGKIGVHEDIIHKETRLTDDEFSEIRAHTLKGDEILKEITDMPRLREGARWHHEHFNGKGYPDGLAGNDIPEAARIVCVADCYDAMTSTRTYSVPKKQSEVRAEIEKCKNTWFDPVIADVMLAMIDEDKEYRMNETADIAWIWKEYDRLWVNPAEERVSISVSSPAKDDSAVIGDAAVLPDWLVSLETIDTDTGLKNCGSADGYLAVLGTFHKTAEYKEKEIRKYFEDSDLENFTVKVHALKSSARIIGATELSLLAEKLETAGREKNMELIKPKVQEMLKLYNETAKALSRLGN
ncbi:MAG: response regulator [Lachnospiraceae bacterium]|nr:response regulator [Lachnospiraceae bacterium]